MTSYACPHCGKSVEVPPFDSKPKTPIELVVYLVGYKGEARTVETTTNNFTVFSTSEYYKEAIEAHGWRIGNHGELILYRWLDDTKDQQTYVKVFSQHTWFSIEKQP